MTAVWVPKLHYNFGDILAIHPLTEHLANYLFNQPMPGDLLNNTVATYNMFENNCEIKNKFRKQLEESCVLGMGFNQNFFIK